MHGDQMPIHPLRSIRGSIRHRQAQGGMTDKRGSGPSSPPLAGAIVICLALVKQLVLPTLMQQDQFVGLAEREALRCPQSSDGCPG